VAVAVGSRHADFGGFGRDQIAIQLNAPYDSAGRAVPSEIDKWALIPVFVDPLSAGCAVGPKRHVHRANPVVAFGFALEVRLLPLQREAQ
jgi:hypothetical protein